MPTFVHHLTASFSSGFYSGVATLAGEVPHRWPVAIGGHGYAVDTKDGAGIVHRSVPLLKQQLGADESEPGEATLNPEGLWRRAQSSWHKGAGQTYRDHDESDSNRFSASKGIDVWTRGSLSLLPDTSQAHASANTNLFVAASQGLVYYADGNNVRQTDLTTASVVTGTPAAAVTGLTSIGATAFAAFGGSGTYSITGTVATVYSATTMTNLGFAKGRLVGSNNNVLYDLSTGAAVAVLTVADTSFVWVAFAEGAKNIYAAGNSGDKGSIYRTAVQPQGTSLAPPTVAGRLPDGETVVSMFGYDASLLFIGTSKGYRIARQDDNGDLQIGPYVAMSPVRAWTASGQYVYFGWSNYDTLSTGVGRIDPTVTTGSTQYAYASDIMVTDQANVVGLGWYNGLVIGVSGLGIHKPATTLVAEGTLDTGIISYRIGEEKEVVGGRVSYGGFGTASLTLSTDDAAYTAVTETGMAERGSTFNMRATLTRGTSTTGPTVHNTLLLAYVAATPSLNIFVSIILAERVQSYSTAEETFDIAAELAYLRALWQTRQLTSYQDGLTTWQVVVEDLEWNPETPATNSQAGAWNGSMTLKMKVIL